MRVTPRRLILAGLCLLVAWLLVGLLTAVVGPESGTAADVVTTLAEGLFLIAALLVVAGVLAWIVKIGVKAAQDDR